MQNNPYQDMMAVYNSKPDTHNVFGETSGRRDDLSVGFRVESRPPEKILQSRSCTRSRRDNTEAPRQPKGERDMYGFGGKLWNDTKLTQQAGSKGREYVRYPCHIHIHSVGRVTMTNGSMLDKKKKKKTEKQGMVEGSTEWRRRTSSV